MRLPSLSCDWLIDKENLERREFLQQQLQQQCDTDTESGQEISAAIEDLVSLPRVSGDRLTISPEVYVDVDMYSDATGESSSRSSSSRSCDKEGDRASSLRFHTVFQAVDRTSTAGSRLFLRALVDSPVCDLPTLRGRQQVLSTLLGKYGKTEAASSSQKTPDAQRLRDQERDVMWVYAEKDEATVALYDIAYFRSFLTRSLNQLPIALTCSNAYKMVVSPLLGLLSPVFYFVVPYVVLRFKMGIPFSFGTYLWLMYKSFVASDCFMVLPGSMRWTKYVSCALSLVFYFQSMFNALEISRALRVVCSSLDRRMRNVASFFDRAAQTVRQHWSVGVRDAFFADVHPPRESLLFRALEDPHARADSGGVSPALTFGESLSRYRTFDRRGHLDLLRAFYAVDAVLSIARLVHSGPSCTFSTFSTCAWVDSSLSEDRPVPRLRLGGLWHPCLDPHVAVSNDLRMHGDNLLLTGPNAGGKSTLIKASVVAVMLAHALGVAPTAPGQAELTPFAFVNSQINVPDVKGRRSLFEEEMARAKANLDRLSAMERSPQQRNAAAFIVIDEIFSSTNPVEGIAGAYSVAKHLAQHPRAMCIISTHYTYLCRLARERRFRLVQMPVVERDGGGDGESGDGYEYEYPYKLRPGVCRQYIALELLRRNGFDASVIDEAIRVKRHLQLPEVGAKKGGAKKAEPEKAEPKKAEPKKAEPEKAEPEKAEPKNNVTL